MPEPRSPRDTSRSINTDGLLLIGAAMADGRDGAASFIEEQERNGQREMVNATTIPTRVRGSEGELTALGFTLGPVVEGDPLFREATLPDGWTREGSDHAMWSYIVDDLGRRRVSIFYKAAFYDRDAHISVDSVYGYLSSCMYDGAMPVLDEVWATRASVLETLAEMRSAHEEKVEFWTEHGNASYVADYRKNIADCDAMKARLEQQDGGGQDA